MRSILHHTQNNVSLLQLRLNVLFNVDDIFLSANKQREKGTHFLLLLFFYVSIVITTPFFWAIFLFNFQQLFLFNRLKQFFFECFFRHKMSFFIEFYFSDLFCNLFYFFKKIYFEIFLSIFFKNNQIKYTNYASVFLKTSEI